MYTVVKLSRSHTGLKLKPLYVNCNLERPNHSFGRSLHYLRKLPDALRWRSVRLLNLSAEMDLIPLRNFTFKLLLGNSQDLPRDSWTSDDCITPEDKGLALSDGEGDADVVNRCLILLTKFLFFFLLFEYMALSKTK
jgi:hypothetical protein